MLKIAVGDWEEIGSGFLDEVMLHRLRIPGGWLVTIHNGGSPADEGDGGVTFVPDPQHVWDGSNTGNQSR